MLIYITAHLRRVNKNSRDIKKTGGYYQKIPLINIISNITTSYLK